VKIYSQKNINKMENYICEGERMQVILTAPAMSGDVLVIGSKVCVAMTSGGVGDVIIVMNEGVFEISKATGAITQGQKLYYNVSQSTITTAASGNVFAGYAYKDALSGDATAQVLLVDNPADPGYVQGAAVPYVGGTDVLSAITTINALLDSLRAAGIIATA
jgi:predicted RecA/RadA family phage recombinase